VSLTAGDLTELRSVVDRYADAVDRRDPDALVALFGPTGRLRTGGGGAGGGDGEGGWTGPAVADVISTVSSYARTFHHVGGAVFEEAGPGEATGRVHCSAHHYDRTANGPVDLVMHIVYQDRYRRDGERWLIEDRLVDVAWTELHPAHPLRRPAP
jgi:hypothetical protein